MEEKEDKIIIMDKKKPNKKMIVGAPKQVTPKNPWGIIDSLITKANQVTSTVILLAIIIIIIAIGLLAITLVSLPKVSNSSVFNITTINGNTVPNGTYGAFIPIITLTAFSSIILLIIYFTTRRNETPFRRT